MPQPPRRPRPGRRPHPAADRRHHARRQQLSAPREPSTSPARTRASPGSSPTPPAPVAQTPQALSRPGQPSQSTRGLVDGHLPPARPDRTVRRPPTCSAAARGGMDERSPQRSPLHRRASPASSPAARPAASLQVPHGTAEAGRLDTDGAHRPPGHRCDRQSAAPVAERVGGPSACDGASGRRRPRRELRAPAEPIGSAHPQELAARRRQLSARGRPSTSTQRQQASLLLEQGTASAPLSSSPASSSATSEELHLAAERWAAMIVEAYLRELRAAAKATDKEHRRCPSPSPTPASRTAARSRT